MSKLKRVGVLSLARVMGSGGLLFGLMVAVFYGLIIFGFGASSNATPETKVFGFTLGAAMLALIPVVYGVGSYLTGLVYACFMNVALRLSGGLEVVIETDQG